MDQATLIIGSERKAKPRLIEAALAASARIVAWLLLVLRPLVRIDLAVLSPRLGHLAGGSELWLRRDRLNKRSWRNPVLFVSFRPSNVQYVEMLARRVRVVRNSFGARLLINVVNRTPDAPFALRVHSAMEPGEPPAFDVWTREAPTLRWTATERRKGDALLERLGIPPGAPFVCFLARDRSYLDAAFPRRESTYEYHDYRDVHIENYLPAVHALTQRGIYCVRMGAVVERPIEVANPLVIDYATRDRSDFGDVFLMAHCKFYLGDTAGMLTVAAAFNRPLACANLIPMDLPTYAARDIFVPKLLRWRHSGRAVTVTEMYSSGAARWVQSSNYARPGIEPVENTPDEVTALALEMNDRIDGRWAATEEEEELQRLFWSLLPADAVARSFPSPVCSHFLRVHREILN